MDSSQTDYDFAALAAISQEVASELPVESVLLSVYEWIDGQAEVGLFFAAFYNKDQDSVRFPLVLLEGETQQWEEHAVAHHPLIAQVLGSRQTLTIRRGQQANYAEVFAPYLQTTAYQYASGVPLIVGHKLLGMIGLLHDRPALLDRPAFPLIINQTSLAIRNSVLYDRTLQLAESLSHINESVQRVMFNLDNHDALMTACKTALQISNAQRVAIFLNGTMSGKPVRVAQSLGLTDAHRAFYDNPAYLPKISSSSIRHVQDAQAVDQPETLHALAQAGGFCSTTEVPMRSGSAVVGLLTVFYDHPYQNDKIERQLLETLAYQITAALDNAELLEALEIYASEQAQLVHLSTISTASIELEAVIYNVCEILRQMMSLESVQVGVIEAPYLYLYDDQQVAGGEREFIKIADIPELVTVQEQRPVARLYYRHDTEISDELRHLMWRDAMMAIVPLVVNDEQIGFIFLKDRETRTLSDSEWRFIELASNQIAGQLHNAQLYRLARAELSQRLKQLSMIEQLAQQISRTLNQDLLIDNVLEIAIRATEADAAALGLITEQDEFHIIGLEYYEGTLHRFNTYDKARQGVMGRVLRSGQPEVIHRHNNASHHKPFDSGRHYVSSVTIPLLTNEGIIGVFTLESLNPAFFDIGRTEFVESLAGHAIISIQNSRMFTERQERIGTLTRLRELSLQVSGPLDEGAIIETLLKTSINVLHGYQALLYVYDENGRLYCAEAMRVEGSKYVKDNPSVPMGLIAQAAQSSEMQTFKAPDDFAHKEFAGMIVMPVEHSGSIREILCVTFDQNQRMNESTISNAELLVIQIAAHLENMRLYQRLSSNNNQVRAILDATRDGILLLDRNGNLIDGNISAEDILKITLEDHLQRNFAETLLYISRRETQSTLENDGLVDLARNLRLDPQGVDHYAFQLYNENQIRYIESVGSPVLDNTAQVIGRLLTLRDVTEARQLEEYRDEVTEMMVHDLREPLGSIIGSIDLLQHILATYEVDESVSELLNVSMMSATGLLDLVTMILDISKMESARMPIDQQPVTLDSMVEETIARLSASIKEAKVIVRTDIPEDAPEVFVDEDLIKRVLVNLLGNAVRFTPTDSEILIYAEGVDANKLVVRVADSGRGIPPEQVERIFEKFRQLEGNDYRPLRGSKGSGVGLAFCKQAINTHGEQIWVEQDGPLPGACFAFTLPTVEQEN
jgi:signal transduction histidine kinase/transcriptional regulator with GAF, ATPase, and Fis domain